MLDFDQVFATLPADGWLSEAEARLLYSRALLTDGSILEVGCYKGRSTCLLASLGRLVHAVDPFRGFSEDDPGGEEIKRTFVTNVADRGHRLWNPKGLGPLPTSSAVVLWEMPVEEWPAHSVGFAYLDGDHTYEGTYRQIGKALQCRGLQAVAVHDVNDSGGGLEVKEAAVGMLGRWTERVERLAVWRL